jgi:hypothetical protein
MRNTSIIAFIIFICPIFYSSADTLTSNGTGGGNWGNASSWDGTNSPGDMADGDTLVIQSGDTITITSPITSFNGVIQVYGILIFDSGKLTMDSNSSIQLATGSSIIALSSGQNDQIRIGDANNKISSDDINNLTTPNQLTEGSLEGGGCAVTGDCEDDPLPVKIIYFKAVEDNGSVRLEWATSFEENFDYFTIERSSDGTSYYEYGNLFSRTKFSSSIKKYEFIDEMPFSGLSYYRLKATDFNGFFEYHGVVAVTMEDTGPKILIYPNPVRDNHISASYSGETETSYKILSITGGTIEKGILNPGINNIRFNTLLNQGIYFLQVEEPFKISEKFIVK